MKKWNEPKVFTLGFEKTYEKSEKPENIHFCHYINDWHSNPCTHPAIGKGNCETNGMHEWNGESHKSACCGGPNKGEDLLS